MAETRVANYTCSVHNTPEAFYWEERRREEQERREREEPHMAALERQINTELTRRAFFGDPRL